VGPLVPVGRDLSLDPADARGLLDGELFSNEGMDGIDGILTARHQAGADVVFGAFGVLQVARLREAGAFALSQ